MLTFHGRHYDAFSRPGWDRQCLLLEERYALFIPLDMEGVTDIPGVLTMFLDKEAYESAGLVGKPHGVKGKRGLKPRWGMC